MIIGSSNRHGISDSPVSMTRWHELKLQEMLSLFVPLLYWKNTLEKINSFGKNVEFYVACPIIFIKLNNFETTDGLFDKFVIGDVIFVILLTLVMVTTVQILLEWILVVHLPFELQCSFFKPKIQRRHFRALTGKNFELGWHNYVYHHIKVKKEYF